MNTQLATTNDNTTNGQSTALLAPANWELAQRMAKAISSSDLVPQQFKNNIPNCIIALEMASRMGASPMAVMQNLYIVHGKPAWSSQFVIAAINSTGRFSPLRFQMSDDRQSCVAWAIELATKERLEGPPVTIAMAKAEGWYGKNGSKWQTMPELMLRYRAGSFFGRLYAPEVLMGMKDETEIIDVQSETVPPISAPTGLPPAPATTASPEPEPEPEKKKPGRPKKEPVTPPPTSAPPVIDQITAKLQAAGFTADHLLRVAILNNWADTTVKSLSEIEEPKLKMFLEDWDATLAELEAHGKPPEDKPPFD